MSTEPALPGSEPNRLAQVFKSTVKGIGLLALVAAISAGAAYAVFQWQIQDVIRDVVQEAAAQATTTRDELRARQDQLEERLAQVQRAAEEAQLLMSQNGETTSLGMRLDEIDTLRLELKKTQEDLDAKLKGLERSIAEEVARQGKETAQALAVELRWKNLLVKAQGEVLLAQVHWAEGNRGLAKDELNAAGKTLQRALDAAPEEVRSGIKETLQLAENAKSALILEQSSARDSLNLLWHKVSEMLAPLN